MKDHELGKKIGFELRSQRLLKRMSLEEVAERMGVSSRNTISYLELGKKSIEVEELIRYCEIVGCDWIHIMQTATGENEKSGC